MQAWVHSVALGLAPATLVARDGDVASSFTHLRSERRTADSGSGQDATSQCRVRLFVASTRPHTIICAVRMPGRCTRPGFSFPSAGTSSPCPARLLESSDCPSREQLLSVLQVSTACPVPRQPLIRAFTAVPPPPTGGRAPHQVARTKYKHLFQTRTRWITSTLAEGHHIPQGVLATLLAHRGISAETLSVWVQVLANRDPAFALGRMGLLESGGEDRERVECPDWLYLAIPGMLQRWQDAPYLVSMLLSPECARMDAPSQGLLVARCMQFFLKVRHYVALRETVEWACSEERAKLMDTRTWARCLTALTSDRTRANTHVAPPSSILHPLAQILRTTMAERDVKPTLATFWPLFHPSLIPNDPKDATRLLAEMGQVGIEPHAELLHAVMKVYARAGDVAGSQSLMDAIVQGREERKAVKRKVRRGGRKVEQAEEGEASIVSKVEEKEDVFDDEVEGIDAGGYLETLDLKPAYGVYDTTFLGAQTDPQRALEYFDTLDSSNPSSPSPDRPPIADQVAWTALFRVITRSPASSQQLLALLKMYEEALKSHRPFARRPSIQVYTVVAQGLNRRGSYDTTIELWMRLESERFPPDSHLLESVASAHLSLSNLDAARHIILSHTPRIDVDPAPLPYRRTWKKPSTLHSVPMDIIAFNRLLNGYNHAGEYAAVFDLYCRLGTEYGLLPDVATMGILLDSARYASAAAGRGYGPGLESITLPGGAVAQGSYVDDNWGGKAAWRVAESLTWEMLSRNWPEGCESVGDPLGRSTSRGFWGWVSGSKKGKRGGEKEAGRQFAATLSIEPPTFPQIYPSHQLFRSFIQLLGYHSNPSTIATALAWMRYLKIEPTQGTITLAVMYIMETSLSQKETEHLMGWLTDWVGEDRVPTEGEIAHVRSGGKNRR